jgi:hypothetical protein
MGIADGAPDQLLITDRDANPGATRHPAIRPDLTTWNSA